MNQHAHRQLADQLLPTVLAAGLLELGYFNAGCAVETKADRSPVTIADRQAEAAILAALADILPGVPVVAEEAFAAGVRTAIGETFLLVDALDGTKQFIDGLREFTINIALVTAGRPVFGLVYAPALGDLLVTDGANRARRAAIAPSAAVANLEAAGACAIAVRPPPADGLVALQSRSRNIEISNAFLAQFAVRERRQLGSSYKFCLIAAGEGDIYAQTGDTREWDTAAGEAVLLAAGGHVTTTAGAAMVYGNAARDYLNPTFVASSAPLSGLPRT